VLGVEEALAVGVFLVDDCGGGDYFAFNVLDLSVFFQEHAERLPRDFGAAGEPALVYGGVHLFQKRVRYG